MDDFEDLLKDLSEDLMTVEEAAQVLKLDEDTIRLWLRTKKLHGYKLGKSWRVSRRSLVSFVEAARNVPEHEPELVA